MGWHNLDISLYGPSFSDLKIDGEKIEHCYKLTLEANIEGLPVLRLHCWATDECGHIIQDKDTREPQSVVREFDIQGSMSFDGIEYVGEDGWRVPKADQLRDLPDRIRSWAIGSNKE